MGLNSYAVPAMMCVDRCWAGGLGKNDIEAAVPFMKLAGEPGGGRTNDGVLLMIPDG